VRANPDGPRDNFLLDTSELGISLEGLIPLDLRIQDVVLGDTFDFDLFEDSDGEEEFGPDDIDSLRIEMVTKNHMPLDMGIQVYFIDENQNWLRVDSLFGEDRIIFESGTVDANGKVTDYTEKTTRVIFDRTKIDNVMDANKILMKAYVDTYESQTRDVKFHAGDYLDFKLRTRVKLNVTFEPDEEN
jgi:hypothetical protein